MWFSLTEYFVRQTGNFADKKQLQKEKMSKTSTPKPGPYSYTIATLSNRAL
jgi:hypothetical protein